MRKNNLGHLHISSAMKIENTDQQYAKKERCGKKIDKKEAPYPATSWAGKFLNFNTFQRLSHKGPGLKSMVDK